MLVRCRSRERSGFLPAAPLLGLLTALLIGPVGPAQAEALKPRSLYFTTISVPYACADYPAKDPGIWHCALELDPGKELHVQLDELLIPLDQVSPEIWTYDSALAMLSGPFFDSWMQGATASTPDNLIWSQDVTPANTPAGMAACKAYRFDRNHPAMRLHIVELGRFCVLMRNPVQWPYILVASVSLLDFEATGSAFPDETLARAQAILSTFRLARP